MGFDTFDNTFSSLFIQTNFLFKRNPNEYFVVGGAYDGYKTNPDGTYVAGGLL